MGGGWRMTGGGWWMMDDGRLMMDGGWRVMDDGRWGEKWCTMDGGRWMMTGDGRWVLVLYGWYGWWISDAAWSVMDDGATPKTGETMSLSNEAVSEDSPTANTRPRTTRNTKFRCPNQGLWWCDGDMVMWWCDDAVMIYLIVCYNVFIPFEKSARSLKVGCYLKPPQYWLGASSLC